MAGEVDESYRVRQGRDDSLRLTAYLEDAFPYHKVDSQWVKAQLVEHFGAEWGKAWADPLGDSQSLAFVARGENFELDTDQWMGLRIISMKPSGDAVLDEMFRYFDGRPPPTATPKAETSKIQKRWENLRSLLVKGGIGLIFLMGLAFFMVWSSGVVLRQVWTRDTPLVGAIRVDRVKDGAVILADGKVLRPAGVHRRDEVSAEDFDQALGVIVAQGVVVVRDAGDGRAFMRAEPKFYNWCGTAGYRGRSWEHWAGGYFQRPVSELLIQAGYALVDLKEGSLTPREAWRLEGVEHVCGESDEPTRISKTSMALRFDGRDRYLDEGYEELLEGMWKAGPR